MRSSNRVRVGTQIIYIPKHARESLNMPNDVSSVAKHPDTEFGFVSSWSADGQTIWCRFWNRAPNHATLRTTANSEACSRDDLEQWASRSPADIELILRMLRSDRKRYGWEEQPERDEHTALVEDLEDLLQYHDWWYQMSDDMRWYRSGQAKQEQIDAMVDTLGDEGIEIYNRMCPYPELHKERNVLE